MVTMPVFKQWVIWAERLMVALLLSSVTACGSLISTAKKEFAEDLSATILEHNDPDTVKQALPSYLVLVSSMIRGDQENIGLLLSGSRLYGSYASVFVEKTSRRIILARKSFDYADTAMCLYKPAVCDAASMSYHEYEQVLKQFTVDDVPVLFAYGAAWAGLIQANRADWNAVAELPRVKATMQRVLELDENFSNGDAHLYMGVMESLLPPAMGGKTEQAKNHFERAIEISGRSNLMAMLMYAEKYARLVFDRELHDRLLNEIINTDTTASATMLIDTIAVARAKQLLADADDYF